MKELRKNNVYFTKRRLNYLSKANNPIQLILSDKVDIVKINKTKYISETWYEFYDGEDVYRCFTVEQAVSVAKHYSMTGVLSID